MPNERRHFWTEVNLSTPTEEFQTQISSLMMKYTTNGVSTFNPLILELEIFKA